MHFIKFQIKIIIITVIISWCFIVKSGLGYSGVVIRGMMGIDHPRAFFYCCYLCLSIPMCIYDMVIDMLLVHGGHNISIKTRPLANKLSNPPRTKS